MKLEVADKVVANTATVEDVTRAFDQGARPDDWYLLLTANDDDFMQVEADEDDSSAFSLEYGDKTGHFKAVNTVDAQAAKTILSSYLHGDAAWRTACNWVAPPPMASPASLVRFVPWIIVGVVIVGIVVTLATHKVSLGLPPPFDDPRSWPVLAIFLAIPGVILFVIAKKGLEVHAAASWTETTGHITKSTLVVRHQSQANGAPEVKNVPVVEYEFLVDGQHVTGRRISLGEDAGVNPEATLARYPQGADVKVFYNPRKPGDCVLERDAPVNMTKLFVGAAVAIFGGIPLVFLGIRGVYRTLGARLPDGHPEFVMFFTVAGAFMLLAALTNRRQARAAEGWDIASGRIVSSGAESYSSRVNGRSVTFYRPAVEYSYLAHGREYRGRRLDFGAEVGTGRALAERQTSAFIVGAPVQVHYDPTNPSDAVLKPAGASTLLPVGLAVLFFGLAYAFTGLGW